MESKWLEDFLSVARTGNFSRSAEERHVTQSTFSRRIKALEQWVGVALIDRSSYPTRLTVAGEQFREVARDSMALLLKTRHDLRNLLNGDRNLLRIAVQHCLAGDFLAQWLAELPLQRHGMIVRVSADDLHDCVRALEEGNADFLVCHAHIDLPLDLDKECFPSLLLSEDKLIPVSRPGARGQAQHALRPETSCPVPWLAYSADTFLGRCVALALEGQAPRLPLQAVFESALVEALRAAAKAGLGVAWLPGHLVAADLASGRLVRAGSVNLDVPLQVRVFGNRASLTGDRRALWEAAQNIAERETTGALPAMHEVCA